MTKTSTLASILLVVAMGNVAEAAADKVGVVGAANGSLTGAMPGAKARPLHPGSEIFFRDHLVTKAGGSAELTFVDRSSLSMGENSDLVIDEFVYHPASAAGTMKATLKRGLMHYVGGDISHGGGTTLVTPTVTIGIRGGIGTIGFLPEGSAATRLPGVPSGFHGGTVVVNAFGTLSVSNAVGQQTITQPGFAVFVGSGNQPIASPVRLSGATMQAMTQALTSRHGQDGGFASAQSGGSGRGGSRADATRIASIATPISTAVNVPVAAPPRPGVGALELTSSFASGASVTRNRSQAIQNTALVQTLASNPGAITGVSGGRIIVTSTAGILPPSLSKPVPLPTVLNPGPPLPSGAKLPPGVVLPPGLKLPPGIQKKAGDDLDWLIYEAGLLAKGNGPLTITVSPPSNAPPGAGPIVIGLPGFGHLF